MIKTVGCIGLGVMGGPMARHAGEHFRTVGFDPDQERLGKIVSSSALTAADSIRAIAEVADVVILSLPTTAVVELVVSGEGGLIDHLRRGTTVIDMSTTEPATTKRLSQLLAGRGIAMIDAPVSGGQSAAEAGTLSIMCGGDAQQIERCRPVLDAIGTSVVRVGEIGSGGVAKLVNNMIVGAAFTSITEGLAICAATGIDPRDLQKAIRGGWAGSPVLDVTVDAVAAGDFTPGGTVNLLSKDLGYARNLARSLHIPMPVTAAVDEIFTAAIARGDGESAQPVIVRMWEDLLGRKIAGGEK